ncbi:unnamed protein product [Ectocarpus sp. 12 AP-2014]
MDRSQTSWPACVIARVWKDTPPPLGGPSTPKSPPLIQQANNSIELPGRSGATLLCRRPPICRLGRPAARGTCARSPRPCPSRC